MEGYQSGCTWSYFVPDVEDFVFNMQHSYSTSWLPYQANVRTVIYNSNNDVVRTIDGGNPITGVRLGDVLDYVGIALDERNENCFPGLAYDENPFFRLTGAIIVVRMKYSNLRSWDLLDRDGLCEVSFTLQQGIWGYIGASMYYDTDLGQNVEVSRNAIRLKFIIEGTIGVFEIYSFVLSVVSSLALIKGVSVLMDYGIVRLYKSHVRDRFWTSKRKRVDLSNVADVAPQSAMTYSASGGGGDYSDRSPNGGGGRRDKERNEFGDFTF